MTDVIEALDGYMDGLFTDRGGKPYGLAELVKKGASVNPVHVDTRAQIAINDKYDVQWYHRILSSGSTSSDEDSFGDKVARLQKVRIRTVFASKHKKGETIRYDFANALPESIEVDGYRRVDLDENLTMIEDQQGVYQQEFAAADYEKHILAWNIVAMEYDISFVRCKMEVCA